MNEPSNEDAQRNPPDPQNPQDPRIQASLKRYWRANITLMSVLLACWAVVGLGCGILFADTLNQYKVFGGFPLGFWFAQQGSIIGFVLIVFIYALAMNRLDKKHHAELTELRNGGTVAGTPAKAPGAMTGLDGGSK